MQKLLLIYILCMLLFANKLQAQKQNIFSRYFNSLIHGSHDVSKPQFLIYPTVGFSPETSWEFGLAGLLVYHAARDTTNRLSEIYAFTFLTLQNQYGFWLDHALYTHENKWFFLGKLRLQSFPLFYHGIGPNTPKDYIALVDANQIQLRERVMRKTLKNLYFGVEADFQRLSKVEFHSHLNEPLIKPLGHEGSANLGFGLGMIYDNRVNVLNVRKGFFSELAFLRYDDALGSNFSFTNIISDTRIFWPVNKRDVLAAQLLGQFNVGNTPFNQLALMGGETIMRGYYLGRYRDKNQLTTQIEYRFLPLPLGFSKRIGATIFASTGTVFNNFNSLSTKNLLFAGGAGARFLLFPKKDIFTRFDVAFTKEGSGFYFFIGEAF